MRDIENTYLQFEDADDSTLAAMTWAQRLKRMFNIDIDTCERCGGKY